MQHVGYSLIKDGIEKRFWGATVGVVVVPDVIILDNGDAVHCPSPGQEFEDGSKFVARLVDDPGQPKWHSKTGEAVDVQADKVIVTFQYAAQPDIVPESVSMRQARLALYAAGKLDAVNAAIEQADKATQLSWEYSAALERDNVLINSLAGQLGMTVADVDDLFRAAAVL